MAAAPSRWGVAAAFAIRRATGAEVSLVAASGLGWVGMWLMANPIWFDLCIGSGDAIARLDAHFRAASDSGYAIHATVHWLLMIGAMMLPLTLEPVRNVTFRSLPRRRARAVCLFFVAYLGIWLAAGGALLISSLALRSTSLPVPGLSFWLPMAAACWQLTPWRRQALRQCHRPPALRPDGQRADLDCVLYGSRQGIACLATCCPAMLSAMLSPFPLCASFILATILFIERGNLRWTPMPIALALVAIGLSSIVA